jgi:hypothetical protein
LAPCCLWCDFLLWPTNLSWAFKRVAKRRGSLWQAL